MNAPRTLCSGLPSARGFDGGAAARRLRFLILAAAALSLMLLLFKLDLSEIWGYLSGIGFGLALILAQEIVAHVMNALGWRFAFTAEQARDTRFLELLKLRIAGDGVNYLTPSGTIAGEFIRAVMLDPSQASQARYASVAIAKLSQALAQLLFILIGLLLVVDGRLPLFQKYPSLLRGLTIGLGSILALTAAASLWAHRRTDRSRPPPRPESARSWRKALEGLPRRCLFFLRDHPARFALSTACFTAGYAWGCFEAYWICAFLGVPVTVRTAMTIELLSNLVDGVFFMVPAKLGTQEAGKTAIFAALGLKMSAGFAFGVVRHIRELAWSCLGLLLCSLHKNKRPPPAEDILELPDIEARPLPAAGQ